MYMIMILKWCPIPPPDNTHVTTLQYFAVNSSAYIGGPWIKYIRSFGNCHLLQQTVYPKLLSFSLEYFRLTKYTLNMFLRRWEKTVVIQCSSHTALLTSSPEFFRSNDGKKSIFCTGIMCQRTHTHTHTQIHGIDAKVMIVVHIICVVVYL